MGRSDVRGDRAALSAMEAAVPEVCDDDGMHRPGDAQSGQARGAEAFVGGLGHQQSLRGAIVNARGMERIAKAKVDPPVAAATFGMTARRWDAGAYERRTSNSVSQYWRDCKTKPQKISPIPKAPSQRSGM